MMKNFYGEGDHTQIRFESTLNTRKIIYSDFFKCNFSMNYSNLTNKHELCNDKITEKSGRKAIESKKICFTSISAD